MSQENVENVRRGIQQLLLVRGIRCRDGNAVNRIGDQLAHEAGSCKSALDT
jgi:hypothetical protein